MPLYLSQVLGVLQDLGADSFSMSEFLARLEPLKAHWLPTQKEMWAQRTYLLDRIVTTKHRSFTRHFVEGSNVIIERVVTNRAA